MGVVCGASKTDIVSCMMTNWHSHTHDLHVVNERYNLSLRNDVYI